MTVPADSWQERHAAQLDYLAAELDKALVEAENAEAILDLRRSSGLTVARAFTAALREEKNAMTAEAAELRATRREPPLPLTTRHVRPPRFSVEEEPPQDQVHIDGERAW